MLILPVFFKKRSSGFTLLELLVVFVVAIIIVTLGVPKMNGFFQRNLLTTQTNRLYGFLLYARSEAIRRGRSISVSSVDESWGSGWVAWLDQNANNQWDTGEEIRQEAAFSGVNLAVNHSASDPWVFNAQGLSSADITFDLCLSSAQKNNSSSEGKSVVLLISGVTYISEKPCVSSS